MIYIICYNIIKNFQFGGMVMKKEDRNNEIVKKLLLNLKFRDIIIIKLFRRCICDAYRLGVKEAYNFEQQNYNDIKIKKDDYN